MIRIVIFSFLVLFGSSTVAADKDAVIVRSASVYKDAKSSSKKITSLPAGAKVTLLERKGGWKQIEQIEPQALKGWVRSYQVREIQSDSAATIQTEEDSRGFLAGLAAFSRKASSFFGGDDSGSSSATTATIGVRGLSEEEIKSAKPDFDEFEKMKSYASNSKRVSTFTKEGNLEAQKVSFLKKKK